MGFFPSSTQVLLIFFFFFTSFLIDFHRKTDDNSGFLVLASTDPELIQNNHNDDYERVSLKKFLQVFIERNNKEQSRVFRAGGGSVPRSPIGNKNRPFDVPVPPPPEAISQLIH